MTNYLDALLGDPQKRYFKKHFPMHVDFLGEYPDFASFFFVMFIACNNKLYLIYTKFSSARCFHDT